MITLTDELKTKLPVAESVNEVTELLKADGQGISPEDAESVQRKPPPECIRRRSFIVCLVTAGLLSINRAHPESFCSRKDSGGGEPFSIWYFRNVFPVDLVKIEICLLRSPWKKRLCCLT